MPRETVTNPETYPTSPLAQPDASPSRGVQGDVPMIAPQAAPLSPSGHHDDPDPQEAVRQRTVNDDEDMEQGRAESPAGQEAVGDETQAIRGIFDGDEEDDVDPNMNIISRRPDANDDDEEEDEEDDAERRRRRRRKEREEEEADEQQLQQQQRKKAKRRDDGQSQADKPVADDGEEADNGLPQMSEQELKRALLDAQIDAAAKGGKKKIKRRKKDGEEDLDPLADQEVAELRAAMMNAVDDDVIANEEKRPALAKLRLLPKVVDGLQKSHWQQSILDSNLLEAVRRFLEPLPDKSLPALNIQRELFSALEKLRIDTISLKMSGLGKIVMFYSRNKRVEGDLRRRSERLIETWSRPILKRSASYREAVIPRASYVPSAQPVYASQQLSQQQSQSDSNRRNVSIPQPVLGGFKIAPRAMNLGGGEGGEGGAGGAAADERFRASALNRERLNMYKRRVKEAKK